MDTLTRFPWGRSSRTGMCERSEAITATSDSGLEINRSWAGPREGTQKHHSRLELSLPGRQVAVARIGARSGSPWILWDRPRRYWVGLRARTKALITAPPRSAMEASTSSVSGISTVAGRSPAMRAMSALS